MPAHHLPRAHHFVQPQGRRDGGQGARSGVPAPPPGDPEHQERAQQERVHAAQGGRHRQLHEVLQHMAHDLRAGLLRRRDDAFRRPEVRHGPLRGRLPRQPPPKRSDDRGRHAYQQNGACVEAGLRPDAQPQVGAVHGQLRQRRRLLPLLLRGGEGLRPNCPRGHLRARVPPDSRGFIVRRAAAAEEDQEGEDVVVLVQGEVAAHRAQVRQEKGGSSPERSDIAPAHRTEASFCLIH